MFAVAAGLGFSRRRGPELHDFMEVPMARGAWLGFSKTLGLEVDFHGTNGGGG